MKENNRVREAFDDEAFRMLRDFRQWMSSTDSRFLVDVEFVSPLTYLDEHEALTSIVGINVIHPTKGPYRLGVTLIFPIVELPLTMKPLRSGFRSQMRKVKKSMIRQFKELRNG